MKTQPLTKSEVLEIFDRKMSVFARDEKLTTVYIIDHNENPLAPESYCYKISYTCSVLKDRHYITLWPYTVGIQGRSKLKGTLLK